MATNTKTRTTERTDAQAKRVASAKRSAITVAEVEQHIASVVAEYGSTGALMEAHKALEETSRTTERGLRAWYPVALEARAANMTVRTFGELSGGSKDTLARLARGAALVDRFERNGATVPAVMVQSVANRTTDAQMVDLLKSIKPGRVDQLPALVAAVKAPKVKGSAAPAAEATTNGGRQSGSANSRQTDWSISPNQYVKALEIMAAYVTALPADKAEAMARTLTPALRTLSQAVQSANGRAPAPGTKRSQARTEAESQAVVAARQAEAEARTAEAVRVKAQG